MTGEIFINNQDAYTTFGFSMDNGFIDAIMLPPQKKAYLSNSSRTSVGTKIDNRNSQFDAKTGITLPFSIEGFGVNDAARKASYLANLKLFYQELAKDAFNINIPSLGTEVYHLVYTKASTMTSNINKTSSKISLVFDEPDPSNR